MEKLSEYDLGDRQELLLILFHEDMNCKQQIGTRDLCRLMFEMFDTNMISANEINDAFHTFFTDFYDNSIGRSI